MELPEALPLPAFLDLATAEEVFARVRERLDAGAGQLVLDLSAVQRADAAGAAVLVEAHRLCRRRGGRLRLVNVPPSVRRLLAFLRVDRVVAAESRKRPRPFWLEALGDWAIRVWRAGVEQTVLHVDALYFTFVAPLRRGGARISHFFHQLDAIGVGSVAIVVLINFLIGLIMALQGAYTIRNFGLGLEIYVANMVGVAMTRELGPLVTAIVVSARSGSSIAAELGTMVVTEEVDALRVMGVDPRRFLVAPRFAAMILAVPCLTTIADVAGVGGGFTIGTLGLGLGFEQYWLQTVRAIQLRDILSGLTKSFIFANVIAVVSCQQGLGLTGGPEEVGRATTRAVVLSIILVILADFVFTTFFYVLG